MKCFGAAVLAVLLVGCASRPDGPVPFSAAALQGGGDEPAAEWQPLVVEGMPAAGGGSLAGTSKSEPQAAEGFNVRHATLIAGVRELDDNTAENLDIDEQFMAGAEFDAYKQSTGDGYEVGTSFSHADDDFAGQDVEATLIDIYGGYRKTFKMEGDDVHPYVSVGAAIVHGDVDIGPASDDDETLGAYFRLGINFDVGEAGDGTRLGVDFRHLFAELDLFGDDFDADFNQLAVTLGFPF